MSAAPLKTGDGGVSREQVWLTTWVAVATSNSCTRPEVPAGWADRCLQEFDKRFPQDGGTKS